MLDELECNLWSSDFYEPNFDKQYALYNILRAVLT